MRASRLPSTSSGASSPAGDDDGDDDDSVGGVIGGVIGGCFVPVLVLVLWLSGAFGPKCPSPFAKKPKPDATSDAGIQVNVSR